MSKAENLLRQIEASKSQPLSKLLVALGIRHVGEKLAMVLAEHFGNMESLVQAQKDQLLQIPELGPIIAQAVQEFFNLKSSGQLIQKLKKAGINMTEPKRS